MFGLDVRTPELARLVPCKEDHAACFFGISFKHKCHRQDGLRLYQRAQRALDALCAPILRRPAIPPGTQSAGCPSLTLKRDHTGWRKKGCESQKSMSGRAPDEPH